jgi:predicted dehydrogenase
MHKEARLLRVGVIGAGPIAQFAHLEACRRARNTELYAICDVAQDLLDRMATIHQPRVTYTAYDRMLADTNLEAVIIGTADAFHVPLALQAVAAGKHVLVEKPLGLDVDECERLKEAAAKTSLVLQVGFNCRFDPALAFTREFIEAELGAISVYNGWYCDSTDRYTMTDNLQPTAIRSAQRQKPKEDPKADKRKYFLLTHGSHAFDTVRFLAGPISSLQARWKESAGAHHWSISLNFLSGCLGTLAIIIPARADFQQGVHVFGEGGSVQGRLHLPWYRKSGEIECFSAKDSSYRHLLGADADSYRLQLEAFAGAILDGLPQRGATLADGVENMRALAATARSVETGRWMRLDEVTGPV